MSPVNVSGRILATFLGLWVGLVLALAYFVGWQVAIPVLGLGIGAALVLVSFLSGR